MIRLSTRQIGNRHKVIINGKESNFHVDELVHPYFYQKFGVNALRFLQPSAILGLQLFRNAAGTSVYVNNWYHGGPYQGSGLRPADFTPSAKFSIHKFGGAYDVKIKGETSQEMLMILMSVWEDCYQAGLRRVEDPEYTRSAYGKNGQDWLHIDAGWNNYANIESPQIIKP